ncbi:MULTISPECIES: hypothetical protein [unclassified Mesorhizobium]|uniref:hypothetical protein n=1 Tax=unclassified Mesorhizobium TaxID=325217 RepID=UPI000FDBCC4F|nr:MULTISPECIES: hypothetical protein [unclassified Mesorhizobium]TGQ09763.1 hypothetical protein EN862_018020 [Mesorhizobium sp. M2E.F.Ca.ET.219.01.1.1]TGT66223.1 hypothetical protein EN809_029140 [Mesorhizobium sp. M2E.F.Ca.ET.166.01.1.1]TGV97978.1 hypothetical protein EN797_029145 [Mesorhizobium sp. M2E.F.Ca.ET.154.01.1.1]
MAENSNSTEPEKSRKIRALIKEAQRRNRAPTAAPEKLRFDGLRGGRQRRRGGRSRQGLCEVVYSRPAATGGIICVDQLRTKEWLRQGENAERCFNPVTESAAANILLLPGAIKFVS